MDHKNKTDQFFREKLDQVEFQPSDQAWKMLQSSIGSKKTTSWATYMKVAASLVLLLTLGLLFYPKQNQQAPTIAEVTSPALQEVAMIEVPSQFSSETEPQETSSQQTTTAVVGSKESAVESVPKQKAIIELASIEEINISNESIALETPAIDHTEEKPAVTITYYTARSTETIQSEDSSKVNVFDKMKFFARNVSAVELLSDIRTAKEELIENGFKRN